MWADARLNLLSVLNRLPQDAQMQTPMHMALAAQDQLIPADVYVL